MLNCFTILRPSQHRNSKNLFTWEKNSQLRLLYIQTLKTSTLITKWLLIPKTTNYSLNIEHCKKFQSLALTICTTANRYTTSLQFLKTKNHRETPKLRILINSLAHEVDLHNLTSPAVKCKKTTVEEVFIIKTRLNETWTCSKIRVQGSLKQKSFQCASL